MALTPYQQCSERYMNNCEVANRCGMAAEEDAAANYYVARRDYKLSKERFKSRTIFLPPIKDDREERLFNMALYSSSLTPSQLRYYDKGCPPVPDTRQIDRELRARAEKRREADMRADMLKSSDMQRRKKDDPIAMLVKREEDEYNDLVELEAVEFVPLARNFYEERFGKFTTLIRSEIRARHTLEDIEASVAMGLLHQLRERIFLAEERLMVRAMGLYPLQLLRNKRNRKEEKVEEEPPILDVMYAAPLWNRVMAIRTETLNEEEINHKRLHLAHLYQRDLCEKGYTRLNADNGLLEVVPEAEIPPYALEAVNCGFRSEALCLELQEETARMNLIDAALDGCDAIFDALADTVSGSSDANNEASE